MKNQIFRVGNLTIDTTALRVVSGLDASRWAGRVEIFGAGSLNKATAHYAGAEGSSEGVLVDFEGENEAFVLMVEKIAEKIADVIASTLGDPCSEEERAMLDRTVVASFDVERAPAWFY